MNFPLRGVQNRQERNPSEFIRDTRAPGTKAAEAFLNPFFFLGFLAFSGLISIFNSSFIEIFLILNLVFFGIVWFKLSRVSLPVRIPEQANLKDPSYLQSGGLRKKSEGIFFVGKDKETGKEIWVSNDDARTHFFIYGTTGSGKTETLISFCVNALSWGSGLIYVDGKADSSLYARIYSLAKYFGREDDVLVVNFMTGFLKTTSAAGQSNTMNPFATENYQPLAELMADLMGGSSGKGGDMWKQRAIALSGVLIRALCYLRDRGELKLDVHVIRENSSLESLIALSQMEIFPDDIRFALNGYLNTLPGYIEGKDEQAQETHQQHGYLTMQMTKSLSMFADTYNYVFNNQASDVDMSDVVLNRRILVVLLPSLEKSEDELANLGKLIVGNLKALMASTLGSVLMGAKKDIIDNRPTNAKSPFVTILDEVGYYTVRGMDVMYAQARSLGFCMIGGAQDRHAMERGDKAVAGSIFANSNFKIAMKLEDPEGTFALFREAAGKVMTTQSGGFRYTGRIFNEYLPHDSVNTKMVDRINLLDLKDQGPGDAHIIFGSRVIRSKMFYSNPKTEENIRFNKFMPLIDDPEMALRKDGKVYDANASIKELEVPSDYLTDDLLNDDFETPEEGGGKEELDEAVIFNPETGEVLEEPGTDIDNVYEKQFKLLQEEGPNEKASFEDLEYEEEEIDNLVLGTKPKEGGEPTANLNEETEKIVKKVSDNIGLTKDEAVIEKAKLVKKDLSPEKNKTSTLECLAVLEKSLGH